MTTVAKICGVYCIFNKVSKKFYIGSSIDVKRRWRDHISKLNRGQSRNIYLQAAWNKYGKDKFEFFILTECSKDCLNNTEQNLINDFNVCDRTIGYNLAKYVGMPGKDSIQNRGSNNGMTSINEKLVFEIKTKLRDKHKVADLAKEYNLHRDCIHSIKQARSWKHVIVEGFEYIAPINFKGELIVFINREGTRYESNNISKFAKEHNLCAKNLGEVAKGRSSSYKGWLAFYKDEKISSRFKFIPKLRKGICSRKTALSVKETTRLKLLNQKRYTLTSPEGLEYTILNLAEFCREHNLNDKVLSSVASGKKNQWKGWKCRYADPV